MITSLISRRLKINYSNKYYKIIKKNLNLKSFIFFQAFFPIAIVNYFYSFFKFPLKKQIIGTSIGILPSVISGILIGSSLNNNLENLLNENFEIFTDKYFSTGIILMIILLVISSFKNIKLKLFKLLKIKMS